MTVQEIRTLYDFNYWAKARILGVVATLSPEQYARNLGSSHGGIRGTLVHTVGAEEIWVKRWKGELTSTLRKEEEFPGLDNLTDWWNMVEHEVTGFCHMLKSDGDVVREVSYKDIKGNPYTMELSLLMQHLVNHSTYHRGQVVALLRQLGVKPVGTDLVAFYRDRRG